MPRRPDPGPPPGEPDEPFPPPPAHVVDPQRFPGPTWDELTVLMGRRDLAYLAWLALLRADPEYRVIASLLVRLGHELRSRYPEPPQEGPRTKAG